MAQTAKKSKSRGKTRLSVKKKKAKLPKRKKLKTQKTNQKKTKPKAKKKKISKKATVKKAKKTVTRSIAKKTPISKQRLEILDTTNTPSQRVTVGDMAPTFTIPDQNGNNVSLQDFRGRKVILYFYPKDDTPGCTKEACSFRDHIESLQNDDTALLGVSFDGQDSHQKFISKYSLNFPLLSDSNKDVANAYGVYVQKNMYGNISMGIERSTFVIDREGRIAAAFRKVQVDGHTDEVRDALNSIA